MPRVIVTEGAARGLERCRQFLATQNPQASRRAGQVILKNSRWLEARVVNLPSSVPDGAAM